MTIILEDIIDWLSVHGWKALAIAAVALIIQKISGAVIDKAVRKSVVSSRYATKEAEEKRENTLIKIFKSTSDVLIWIVAGVMIISEFGINTAPLLAALGVTGLAFGFGGQYLIKDVISGLFIILENQYRVGDVVCFDGTCGLVEDITLRATILRDLDGTVHHVPHGVVSKTANLSKHYSRVNLDIAISYASDLEKVIEVINRVGLAMAEESAWKDRIVSPPQFLRVDDFAASGVVVKVLGDTKPLAQWEVTGELRKRIKIAFDKEGIEIPFPQMVVHQAKL